MLTKRRKIDGRKLRALRERRGWSLRVAAHRLGVSAQALNHYERGLMQPKEETLERMLPVLGVTFEDLWRDYGRSA